MIEDNGDPYNPASAAYVGEQGACDGLTREDVMEDADYDDIWAWVCIHLQSKLPDGSMPDMPNDIQFFPGAAHEALTLLYPNGVTEDFLRRLLAVMGVHGRPTDALDFNILGRVLQASPLQLTKAMLLDALGL